MMLCIVAASAFASLPPAVMEAPPTHVQHFAQHLDGSSTHQSRASALAPAWTGLERLTIEERLNSDVRIVPQQSISAAATVEVHVIEQLWNSGQFDAALARFRGISRLADPSGFFVGVNWRRPIPSQAADGFGNDVQVGARESAYCTAFDRDATTGNLMVALLRHAGTLTYIDMNLSTDGGSTWAETFDGSWSWSPVDLDGTCNGPYMYIGYPSVDQSQAVAIKFDASSGAYITFHSGDYLDTIFQMPGSATLNELAMCSADDEAPNDRIYTFGRTSDDSLVSAWSDSFGEPWHPVPTGVNWCHGQLSCSYNILRSTHNWLFAGWLYQRTADTAQPAIGWFDDTSSAFHALWAGNLPTTISFGFTGLAAYKDTVLMAYTHEGGTNFYTQALLTYDAGSGWNYVDVPDTLANRETPDVTGRHGDGFALAHREYGGDREIMFTHAPYASTPWSAQESVGTHSPNYIEKPRVQWVAPGVYGVTYLSWVASVYNTVWYNRSDWTGIAEQHPTQPTMFGFRAQPEPGGARLVFSNPVAGNVQLRVFDATGRMVHSRQAVLGAGAQSFEFSSPTSGIYFAELETGARTSVAKFFVTR